ncbi:MAG: tetratricopeptide repeat protein, partial [Bacteroidaceae bacterium]|nr:tetratricopeptide repeat protein [Bacteroidaceae bacterium]
MKITLTIKRLVLIAIILAISIETYSQKNIKGRIFEYTNETNLPLSGVGINNVFDTVTIFSDSLGHFEIIIPAKTKKSIPKPFINRIEKKDYMIMNVVEIDSEDMDIIMCKQETYYSLFNEFKRIGLKNFEATNNHKLNEYRLQKEKKLISHPEYNNYLKAIYDNELAYRKTLNNTSQYFVEIDKSRFDSIVHQCISLILEDKIQDAIDLCSNQNYTQQYIEQYEKSKKEYIKRHIDFETNLLRFSSLSDKFEKIGNIYYKLAIYNIESIPILMEYANFLYEQRNFEKAIDWYNQLIKRNNSPYIYANINNILGSIYFIKEEYSKSEELYLSAIEILDSIIKENYYSYSPTKADVLTNLATLYKSTRNYNEALYPFEEALKINKEFSFLYPEKYISQYAINLINLASLHNELGNDSLS